MSALTSRMSTGNTSELNNTIMFGFEDNDDLVPSKNTLDDALDDQPEKLSETSGRIGIPQIGDAGYLADGKILKPLEDLGIQANSNYAAVLQAPPPASLYLGVRPHEGPQSGRNITPAKQISYPKNHPNIRGRYESRFYVEPFVGNPVSYSQRVFEERSKLNKGREKKQVNLLDEEPSRETLPKSDEVVGPSDNRRLTLSDAKAVSQQDSAATANMVECGLGLQHVIFANNRLVPFEHLRNLGSGALSIVDEVKSTKTGGVFARKSINVSSGRADLLLPMIQEEVGVLKRLSHAHIITIQGTYQAPRTFCIIMSPVGDGDLGSLMDDIAEHGFLIEQRTMIWQWASCLVSALLYIHEQGVRHRDIKPANIIYEGSHVYMTDFGSCRQFDMDTTSSTNTAFFGNTKLYSAPEVLMEDAKRGRPADIFSLGCVFLEIYSVCRQRSAGDFYRFRERLGNPAFGFVSQETLLEWTSSMTSNDIRHLAGEPALLLRMLNYDPSLRPSAKEVSLNLKCKSCGHTDDETYKTVHWPTRIGDEAGGEQKQVY